ncbi:MAG: hypothetical protein ACX98W_01460 [bacterium]
MKVRLLTNKGMELFEAYLGELRSGSTRAPDKNLLTDEATSEAATGDADLALRSFKTRFEAAEYLADALKSSEPAERDHGRGLWSWLSLFYFDEICPPQSDGRRAPGESYRHIPSTHWRHYHRHLLLGPYRILTICGEKGRIMLTNEFGTHGDFAEQLASRQELIVNRSLMELVDRLYFDESSQKAKKGAATGKKPGTLRRLIDLINQLDLTYDLYAMTSYEMEALLPAEFDRFRS